MGKLSEQRIREFTYKIAVAGILEGVHAATGVNVQP
jgi:hypothetical protein